jgi:predicted Rossmann fold nucleotide-binding protein DprA/Smf involved in DNA uptake
VVATGALVGALGLVAPAPSASPTDPILEALAAGALDADALRRNLRQTESEFADRLLRLTLAGMVTKTPDGRLRAC